MSLEVSVTKGTTYTIKCENIDHTMGRLVTQTGLPADSEGATPKQTGVFLLDLGICTEQITLTGVVETNSDNGTSKAQMENVVRSWWSYGDAVANLLLVTLPNEDAATQQYYGAIRNASFKRISGVPDRWEFSITFLIKAKVGDE